MELHYEVATVLLIFGYSLFVVGLFSNAWKTETNYDYGLWYRCDRRECVFYSVDYLDNLNLVRVGVALSTLLFGISFICLLIEVVLVINRSQSKHRRRLGRAIIVTIVISEISTSVCLGFYGYETVIMNEKFPSLKWGFASTGFGVMSCFLGTILRIMGPPSTWDRFPCLISKDRRQDQKNNKVRREIYRSRGNNRIMAIRNNNNSNNNNRAMRVEQVQPRDVVIYRKVSDDSQDSCENLFLTSTRKSSSQCSTHHRYEEIFLDNDALYTQRRTLQRMTSTPTPMYSHQPSPTLPRNTSRDMFPRKTSSLPPGISPGFYPRTLRHQNKRCENEYEEFTAGRRPHNTQSKINLRTLPVRPNHLLPLDCRSIRSAPTPTPELPPPPPSPPLPPPPPPLTPTTPTSAELVNVRTMRGSGNVKPITLAPSTNSLQSFGYHGFNNYH